MKKFLFIATLLASWLSISPTFAQNVAKIGTVDQLKAFRDAVNSGTTYAGQTVLLTADLDLSSEPNWTPIGNLADYESKTFYGTFDGDGHTISNLTVNDNTPNYAVAGLFGSILNGAIRNLTVKNVNITSTHFAGGIVAYTSRTPTIENCHVIGGTITSTPELLNGSYDNGDKAGGIMGYATAGSTINNCTVEGVTITAYRDLGGIVGYSAGNVTNNTVIDVTVTQDLTNGYKNPTPTTVGDIVGGGSATLSNNKVINTVAKIGDVSYGTIADAVSAANVGDVIEVVKAGDYTLPGLPKYVTIEGAVDGVVFNHTLAGNVASIPTGATFKNVTFNFGNVNYHGFQHPGTINMEGCTLNGKLFSYGDMNFTNCQFNQSNSDYHMWTYAGNVTYTNCTFTNSATGKFLNVYNEGATKYTVTVNNCKFVNNASAAKAALNVKATSGTNLLAYDVIINNCTTEGAFPAAGDDCVDGGKITGIVVDPLVQVDDRKVSPDNIRVYKNGELIYPEYTVKVVDNEGNESKYGDMKDAFDAINANPKESYTITLLKDAAYTDAEQYRHAALTEENTVTKSVVIDGANHSLTFVGGGVRGFYTKSTVAEKVTFQNMTIVDNTRYDAENGNNAWEFAYLEMGEKESCALEFTNVKFADGISVDGTKTTFTNCEFIADGNAKRSTQTAEHCMWISNGEVTIDNCTFTGYRAIKLHEAYGTEISSVVINDCTIKDLSVKPAVVIGTLNAATSVTITNCTIEGVQKGDQSMYLYESDTDLANFTNNFSGNTFNVKDVAELTVALNAGAFTTAVLLNDITLTEDITCGLEEGTFTLVQGDKALNAGDFSIKFNPGVTFITDKQTDVFTAVDSEMYTIEETVLTEGDYRYQYKVTPLPAVAAIGETGYPTLQKALDAAHEMTGDVTITLIDDITEVALVHQKAGLNLTIDGDSKTLKGQINIDGDGRLDGTDALTIKNIKFVYDASTYDEAFVYAPNTKTTGKVYTTGKYNYDHNVTVTDCEFAGEGTTTVAVRVASGASGKNLTIANNTVVGGHSFAQLTGVTNLTVTNNNVTGVKNGINISGGGGTATFTDNTLQANTTEGYTVRFKEGNSSAATLENNTFGGGEGIVNTATAGAKITINSGYYAGPLPTEADRLLVNGGYFTVAPAPAVCTEGLFPVGSDQEDYPYTVGTAVAEINGSYYSTLEAAFAAAADGATVNLLANVELTDRLFVNAGATPAYAGTNNRYATTTENKSITLDLKGYNVTSTSNIALAGGSLNITNSGTADATHGVISTSNSGLAPIEVRGTGDLTAKRTLTVGTGVTLSGAVYGLNVFGSNDAQKNIIDVIVDGTVVGELFVLGNLKNDENNIVITVNGSVDASEMQSGAEDIKTGIALNGNAKVIVNEDASVKGETGIEARAGELTVNAGTIEATAQEYSYKPNNSGTTIKGAAIAVASYDATKDLKVTVSDGTLSGGKLIAVVDVQNNMDKVTVTAKDEFVDGADETVIPADYKWVSENGMSTLAPCVYVAQIGDVKYESLADAVAAVPADGTETTITMIDNETIDVVGYAITIPATKNVILDLNGFQVVGTASAGNTSALITNYGTLTIKDSSDTNKDGTGTGKLMSGATPTWTWDGTDDYSGSYASNLIRNEKNLIVESGNLYNMSTGSAAYAIDNYGAGNVTINGGKVDAAKASAIRMFYNNGGSVTVNGGVVGGENNYMGIQAQSGTNAIITINGGTISGQYAVYGSNTGGNVEISGGTFYGYVGFGSDYKDDISITGGVFNSWVGTWGSQTKFISGGLFAEAPSSSYIKPAGYMFGPSEEVEGYYTLVPAEVDYSWIENGEVIHDYLPFNIPFKNNYLMDGETITLLQDITLTEDLTWNTEGDAAFTLNLGEFKITKGNFSIKLNPGQRVNTDKTTSINAFTADEGYVVKSAKDEDGKYYYTVEEAEVLYTAANGTEKYMLYSSSMVSADGTYKLLKDVTTGARLAPGILASNITLDLNGHTLTSTATDCAILLSRAGTSSKPKTFNLIDTSDEKGGMLKVNPDVNIGIQVSGKYNQVTIGEGVTVDGDCIALLSENQTLTVNGTINGGNDFAVSANGSTTKNTTITINDGAVLTSNVAAMYLPGNEGLTATVNGGTITGGTTGIEIRAGQLVVNGGSITSTATEYSYTPNGNGTTTKGAAIAVVQHNTKLPIDAQILGGTLTGLNQIAVVDAQENSLEGVAVKAKDELIATTTIPEAFKWVSNGDGTSSLAPKDYVAQIADGAKYETLEEAFAAATDGATITLLDDCAGNGISVNKSVTVDFAGKTYTITGPSLAGSTGTQTQAFQLLQGKNITFKNGAIVANNNDIQMMIQNYANLTLDNMVLDATQGTNTIGYVLSTNYGNTTINNTTITAKADGIAFDACTGWGGYTGNNVEVKGTSVINGDIEVSFYGQGTAPTLTITSGTINGDLVMEEGADQATITKNDNVALGAPEDYMWVSNGDGTSTLGLISDQDIVLIDKEPYTFTKTTDVKSVTYKRTLSGNYTGYYISWYVPFDYTITAEDAENMTFYKIHMIANSNKPGEVEDTDKIWVYLTRMKAGDKLYANRPYVFKAPNAGTTVTYSFTTENTKLYAPETGSRMNTSTSKFDYNFYGTYDSTPLEKNLLTYYTNSNGKVSATGNTSVTLTSYRWYIKATAKYGDGEGYAPVFVFTEDDDDATGISQRDNVVTEESYYNLNGMRINKPAKGTYIIKYSDGSVKKVAVK